MLTIRQLLMSAIAVLFAFFLAISFFGCGGSRSPEHPLGIDRFGVHLNPVDALSDGTLYFPTDDDYVRIRRIGSYIIANLYQPWWDDPALRPRLLDVWEQADFYQLRLIVRMDSPTQAKDGGQGRSDEAWFDTVWTPYVIGIVEAGRGRTWAYQVMNEVEEKDNYMAGPTGEPITVEEYLRFYFRTVDLMRGIDPDARIMHAGITTITESAYTDWAVKLLTTPVNGRTLESSSSHFNVHLYSSGLGITERLRLSRIRSALHVNTPIILTETNHINPGASGREKWEVIQEIYRVLCGSLRCPEAVLAFCWNAGGPVLDERWQIKDTGLEQIILEAWGR